MFCLCVIGELKLEYFSRSCSFLLHVFVGGQFALLFITYKSSDHFRPVCLSLCVYLILEYSTTETSEVTVLKLMHLLEVMQGLYG